MKTLSLLALLGLSFAAHSAHDGYIIKLKNKNGLNRLGITASKVADTSFGTYAVVSETQARSLERSTDVEYVEPNFIYTKSDIERNGSDEAQFSKQWGLKNTGSNSGSWWTPGKAGEDINAEQAWEITKGDKELIVAVIDTGIDFSHPDLKDNMWSNEAELNGEAGVDDDGNGFVDDVYGYDFVNKDGDPTDGHGHGTHCAGVIGASHNGSGIAGIMANVKLMGLKFLSDSGSGDTLDAITAIDYAVLMGAKVLNNSWGGGGASQALLEAIESANEAGVVFIAAAGNSYADNDSVDSYPADYEVDNVISVGAMSGTGKKANFSNYGDETVHVFAPGDGIYSTVKNGGYQSMSGTSMAAPHVAGIAGLLFSQDANRTPAEIKEILIRTSKDNGSLGAYSISGGRVDAFDALRY